MKNHKQAIGYFRLTIVLILMFAFNLSLDFNGLEKWVSDMIHGSHSIEYRDSTIVSIVMGPILIISGFYIFQTLIYIFVGGSLDGKNTSLLRFVGYVISGIRGCVTDKHFWLDDSGDGRLNNIERVISYRDNKMAFMSNKEAAKYMKGTGHIDMMISRPELKQSRKALSYLNNKMAFMDNEAAVRFLKSNK